MKRDLPYLRWKTVSKGGKTYGPYAYFRRGGKDIRIHAEPDTEEFAREYWAIRSGANAKPARTNWGKLVESYIRSPAYAALSAGTKANYRRHLDAIREKNGPKDVRKFRRSHAIAARNALADTWSKANERIAVLSILLNHAVDLEWIPSNPVRNVSKLKGGEHKPWPVKKLDAFRRYCEAHDLTHERALLELAIGTGQRLGDCLAMTWDDFDGEFIRVVQQKTGAQIWVACPARLLAYLGALPKAGRHILSRNLTQPMSKSQMQKRVAVVRDAIGADGLVIHGWRYNAAAELADAGASVDEIMAVTGHKSAEMARKYAGQASQKSRSKRAQDRRE